MTQEASIIINGKELTVGQSMAVRVALNSFISSLKEEGIGNDQIGINLTKGYINNSGNVLELIHTNIQKKTNLALNRRTETLGIKNSYRLVAIFHKYIIEVFSVKGMIHHTHEKPLLF